MAADSRDADWRHDQFNPRRESRVSGLDLARSPIPSRRRRVHRVKSGLACLEAGLIDVGRVGRPERSRAATSTGRPGSSICPAKQPPGREGRRASPSGIHPNGWARATRKPRLLFRFSGVFLFRFDARVLSAVLFQLLPRVTRSGTLDRSPSNSLSPPCEIASSRRHSCVRTPPGPWPAAARSTRQSSRPENRFRGRAASVGSAGGSDD